MKYLNSPWYAITVGLVFAVTFILMDGGTVAGAIYISSLTFCWALERKTANMWKQTAYDIGGK